MGWLMQCADCGHIADDEDCTVIDQEMLLESLKSGEITVQDFIDAGSDIGKTVCPECSSPELLPLEGD